MGNIKLISHIAIINIFLAVAFVIIDEVFKDYNIYAWLFAIFTYLIVFRRSVLVVGICMFALMTLYFVWDMKILHKLNKEVNELKKSKERLTHLSYTDSLTSINNRTKYNEVWKRLKENPVTRTGFAYFDLNGLKQINDSKSHDEGDKYICATADIIFAMFQEDCYRIGGDEFVALSVGIDEAEFAEKISQIRDLADKKDVSVSIGSCWLEKCDDIRIMRKEAEEKMYKEKEIYYLTHDRRNKTTL